MVKENSNRQCRSARRWFIHTALSYLGRPYIWGGDDPSGFDCSGLVVECLKSIGLIREDRDLTANGLWNLFADKEITVPAEGALLFSISNNRAVHVVICLDEFYQIGAGGGDSGVTSETEAWRSNAFVKIRPVKYAKGRYRLVDPFNSDD